MNIDIVYGLFGLAALEVFRRCRPDRAVLIVFLGGWLLLPVGHYPAGAASAGFAYWITGLALPSEMPLTKAWIAPAAALLGALLFDARRFAQLRFCWRDAPLLAWCAWPLLQSFVIADVRPAGWLASLYLFGGWGLPWLLGRLYFSTAAAQRVLVRGLVVSALACLPLALIEGVLGPWLYDAVYEPHPFRLDGADRYLGFRPIGFFEHGNQYGLWIGLCALAALWIAASSRVWTWVPRVAAGVVTAMALAAQSLGAMLLLVVGAGVLWSARFVRPQRLAVVLLALLIGVGAVYVSGIVPVTRIGKETAIGQRVVAGFKSVGRGSFTWRISQDQQLMTDAMARPATGSGAWDWWRPRGTRPWGLAMLLLGQFGLIGLALAFSSLLLPAVRAVWPMPTGDAWSARGLPLLLATLILLTLLDALLNSFIFFPAILIAGGLAGMPRDGALIDTAGPGGPR